MSQSASIVGVSSRDKDTCVSIPAGGTVRLLTSCFGDISRQNDTITVNINHV